MCMQNGNDKAMFSKIEELIIGLGEQVKGNITPTEFQRRVAELSEYTNMEFESKSPNNPTKFAEAPL